MVSVLGFELGDPGSGTGWNLIVLCSLLSWARNCTLTMPLSTQHCKWLVANCARRNVGCYPGMTGIPSTESTCSNNTPVGCKKV